MYMKNLLKISLFSMLFLSLACSDDDNDTLTGSATEGGYIDVVTEGVTYSQGQDATELMSSSFSLFQGNEKVETVEVFKQFFGKVDVGTPDEAVVSTDKVLLTTISMPLESQYETVSYDYSYNDLISGMTFNGAPMPTSDLGLNIGDYWVLTYVSHLTNGDVHSNVKSTRVTIACGTYLEGNYNLVVTITAGSGTGSVFNMPGEVLTKLGGTRYQGNSIGPYNDRGLVSANAQIPNIGLIFDDICSDIILYQDPSWAYSASQGIPDGTAQFLANYTNAVYQVPAQLASSSVDPVTGVITIDYNIWFQSGTTSYRGVYTPAP